MISKFFVVALLASFFIGDAAWTDPATLLRLSKGILSDACIDSNNHTLVLLQSVGSRDLLAFTYVSDGSYIDNTRQVMKNQGQSNKYPRSRILCRQNANNDVMVFSVVSETGGAGILAEAQRDDVFVEKYKREDITAGSLLFINSTERTVLFLSNHTTLWFVTRPAGSEVFSKEQIIYINPTFYITDVTSAVSKRRTEFLWHVAVRVHTKIYYFLGAGNGVKWEDPYLLEGIGVRDHSLYQISFIANYDISSTIFLAYASETSDGLNLTWTSNNGDTWAQAVSTSLTSSYFIPYGFLYKIDGKPALFLSDDESNYVISKSWTENGIGFNKGRAPVIYPVYTLKISSPSLLQGFGRNAESRWILYTNQTEESSLEEVI